MQGKIVKGIAGFYYVHVQDMGIYECKAKGIFRKDNTKPLVGDDVAVEVLDEEKKLGNISVILPRKNSLIRPAVANVDQALVIFSITEPAPNFNLLDRFLIMMEQQALPCIICFNKQDISSEEDRKALKEIYEGCGCRVFFTSAGKDREMEELLPVLKGRTTTVAGPSGVGKSSIINCLAPEVCMETGEISKKIQRGKHTTRHTQLIALGAGTYIMDTPGFSSLALTNMEKEELQGYYPEFARFEAECRFRGCAHIQEPGCGIKAAVQEGLISRIRYGNYVLLYEELKDKKKY